MSDSSQKTQATVSGGCGCGGLVACILSLYLNQHLPALINAGLAFMHSFGGWLYVLYRLLIALNIIPELMPFNPPPQ